MITAFVLHHFLTAFGLVMIYSATLFSAAEQGI